MATTVIRIPAAAFGSGAVFEGIPSKKAVACIRTYYCLHSANKATTVDNYRGDDTDWNVDINGISMTVEEWDKIMAGVDAPAVALKSQLAQMVNKGMIEVLRDGVVQTPVLILA